MHKILLMAGSVALSCPAIVSAEPLDPVQREQIEALVAGQEKSMAANAGQIWKFAEPGFQEHKSSALLADTLRKAGFAVKTGVAGMPTAFVASFRTGPGPVIGILAEYDALPGIAQTMEPRPDPIPDQAAGHGCGHNLIGSGATGAAIALAKWMKASGVQGEVRVYGSPAEEGGDGKAYLVRAGLFNDVDGVLHWHPSTFNSMWSLRTRANIKIKFDFEGVSAHGSVAPEAGRSALDAVQLLNMSSEFMREHIPSSTRMHYIIENGGLAANVVPARASTVYYVRNVEPDIVRDVVERLKKAAEGVAMATGTKAHSEVLGGVYSLLPNPTLNQLMATQFEKVGAPRLTPAQLAAAKRMEPYLEQGHAPYEAMEQVNVEANPMTAAASTDVSDVSWVVPVAGITTAAWLPGTTGHAWQAVAASGSAYSHPAMNVAARVIALTAAEMMTSPDVLAKARTDLIAARGKDFVYEAMLGDRQPALDFATPRKER